MCDYSLQNVKSRPAAVGDKLHTQNFGSGTIGFAGEDPFVAVCVLPGTEIAFDEEIKVGYAATGTGYSVAIFRQFHKELANSHHDALELPNGGDVMLTSLTEGQLATVLQLPAAPKTEQEAKDQQRLEVVG